MSTLKKYAYGLLVATLLIIGTTTNAEYINSTIAHSDFCDNMSCRYRYTNFPKNAETVEITNTPSGVTLYLYTYDKEDEFRNLKSSTNATNGKIINIEGIDAIDFYLVRGQKISFKFFIPDPPIIQGGQKNFTPIIEKTITIFKEIAQYIIYICITTLGITLMYKAIIMILKRIKGKSKGVLNR